MPPKDFILDKNLLPDLIMRGAQSNLRIFYEQLFLEKRQLIRGVYGGSRLEREYRDSGRVFAVIRALQTAGRFYREKRGDLIDAEEVRFKRSGDCRSDDEHILALGKISGTRVLISNDCNLAHDFKEKCSGKVIATNEAHNKPRHPKKCEELYRVVFAQAYL